MARPLLTIEPGRATRAAATWQRRGAVRRLFSAWQRVAALDSSGPGAWQCRRCHDLSSAGFSFWTDVPPAAGHVVLSLAGEEDDLVLAAEVRHATPLTCLAEPVWLVGCRFVS